MKQFILSFAKQFENGRYNEIIVRPNLNLQSFGRLYYRLKYDNNTYRHVLLSNLFNLNIVQSER